MSHHPTVVARTILQVGVIGAVNFLFTVRSGTIRAICRTMSKSLWLSLA